MVMWVDTVVELLAVEIGHISDYFAYHLNDFLPTGLPLPALKWGIVASLI